MNGFSLEKAKWMVVIVVFSTTFAAFPNPVGQQGWRLPKMYPKPGELFHARPGNYPALARGSP
jgi:hypothetical protein